MATCCQQERDLCRAFMQSTKQIKIPTAILEIIPRRLQRKIPDVRPVQGFAYIIRLGLISGLGVIHKLR